MGGALGWLDRTQQRHPVLGAPLGVLYKMLDDQGFYLAALIAFYAFLSLFPLFMLLSAILGFALESNPGLREAILTSAAAQIPVIGQQIEARQLTGSGTAATIAVVAAVYGSLGVAQAIQNAMNVTWGVPRHQRPNPFASRARSLGLLAILGLFVVATTFITQVGAVASTRLAPWIGNVGLVTGVGSLALSAGFFVLICQFGTAAPPPVSHQIPGAVLGAFAWQGLQTGGTAFITSVVARASTTNGIFAIVLGLIAWLYLAAITLVVCLEVNVVFSRRLYPRSLLTPMTDLVDLTEADQAAYARLARTQTLKGFQHVDVSFEHDGQYATAVRARARETTTETQTETQSALDRADVPDEPTSSASHATPSSTSSAPGPSDPTPAASTPAAVTTPQRTRHGGATRADSLPVGTDSVPPVEGRHV